ncbi:MAG: Crp/Fnr family transcriptional regulator [Gloeomargaritaceae cyanobacterium C42_A2020_066]|nr:Crp/Fnr family transcriptional regulator [Gloeomargaritaceae cyanobacterium C42_A2020_066]
MTRLVQPAETAECLAALGQQYLLREIGPALLAEITPHLEAEKLYSSRPIYTAGRPGVWLESLYLVISGGPVILRSTPLDRVIAVVYPGGSFGMHDLPLGCGRVCRAFPSLVEAYKTTAVLKLPLRVVETLYDQQVSFRQRYDTLFEIQQKFQYHLLNCSAYPPQAVAALLRALVYQERELGHQPSPDGIYRFNLPLDIIARACQLNHRTVDLVLKGMVKAGLIQPLGQEDTPQDQVAVVDPERLKEVYGATRDKVDWWPLR